MGKTNFYQQGLHKRRKPKGEDERLTFGDFFGCGHCKKRPTCPTVGEVCHLFEATDIALETCLVSTEVERNFLVIPDFDPYDAMVIHATIPHAPGSNSRDYPGSLRDGN